MKSSSYQSPKKRSVHEWVSAIGTLLVLSGIYASMDNFSSYAPPDTTNPQKSNTTMSVAPPYWNSELGYGFRSIAGDLYDATGSYLGDVVSVRNDSLKVSESGEVKVSYYKDTSMDVINKSLRPDMPRTYTKLPHGIAVIQGDLDSARAKTIFSTLHSE